MKCLGCDNAWTAQGTAFCGPCLQRLSLVPQPLSLAEALMGPPERFSMLERAIWHVLEDGPEVWSESIQNACIDTLEQCEGAVWNA